MRSDFHFTFENIEQQYRSAQEAGYQFITCDDYACRTKPLAPLTIVNRVDIDMSVKKADRLRLIFKKLDIKASFFVRLHAVEYNPFSFENYRIIKAIKDDGHEIGYHSEIIDQSVIWDEDPAFCLRRDLMVLNTIYGLNIKGVASHGGITGLNNLDFWKNHSPADFNLNYEAYEKSEKFNLFDHSFYISDSEWTRWKCYQNGKLCVEDRRSMSEHIKDRHPLIYLLIHPDTYFDKHIYE